TAQETAEAAAETAAAAVAAAEEAADAAREAAESAAMAGEDEPAAAGGPVYGGKIVRVAEGDIDSGWNPHRTTTNLDNFNFLQYIYDYVLGYSGDNGAAKAELAESWEIPDDVTYLFNFAPGRAVFQDGAPVDANAMQANMEFLRDDEEATPSTKAGIANAASFEAVDDVTWRMVNSEVVGPTLSKFYDQTGSGNLISPNALETAHEHPVGAGPARPVEYRVGEYWLGEKWDGYWDNEHVYADQLEVRIIPDANNAWAQFLDGEISYQPAAGVMTDELAAELEADGFQVSRGLSLGWNAQWFNLNPAAEGFNMFRDPRLRWAIGLSVDRDVVNDLSEDGLGKPSVCNTSTESWAIREGANYYDPPDLAKAAQLRDAAGFGDDNPVTGDFLTINNLSPRTGPAVFAQLQQAGWSGLNLLEGSLSFIFEVFATGTDHVTSTMPWASPFDPDVVMGPSIDQGLRNWMHGSPEGGPGTGRASLAENPNDQVLQDIAETEAYTVAATKFARQEDRIEPYDKAFASACDGNSWSDPDIQGHRWWYYWLQLSAGYGAQGNLGGGFHIRPIDGFTSSSSGGHGYKGLWNNA
ncbi:MAG: ABC transporter substrate-binding protein, partial [Chloroflexi bacterium]|nr:ABC transporter substrate-binding protein [Chloroflexota bacterium]